MQPSSVFLPLMGDCFPVSHSGGILLPFASSSSSSCNSTTSSSSSRRRKTNYHNKRDSSSSYAHFSLSSDSYTTTTPPHFLHLSSKFGFPCGCRGELFSKFNFLLVCEPPNTTSSSSFNAPSFALPLALAFEQEALGHESSAQENTGSIDDGMLETIHADEEDTTTVGSIQNNQLVVSSSEQNEICSNEENEVEENKTERVDVRELGLSLRFAKTADDVQVILQDMKELPLPVYSSMIRGFGVDKNMGSAMAVYEWLKLKRQETNGSIAPNLFIYNSLLGAIKTNKQFGQVQKIMEDMAEEGIAPNIVTYNALMAIYLEQARAKEALNLFEEIQNKALAPTPVTYSTVLLAYRRMEDGNGALRFFVELREKYRNGEIIEYLGEDLENEFVKLENFTIRVCFQVMRRWLVKGGHLSTKVLKLLMDMDEAGLKSGRLEQERLVWACTLESHYIVAKELYTRIRERESEISLSVCNHVIWLMGKAKKWWAALEIYEDLLDKGPKPNNLSYELIVSHFNILLTAAKKRGIWRWGVRLLNKMEEKGLKPRSREWNSVLVACSKASETSAAVQIFRRMIEQGEKPTIISYGALLSALEKGKLYDEALRVWDHMIKVGLKPNLYAYTTMASVYIGTGRSEMVESIIKEMKDSGIEPTVVTYNAIISGCARNGMGGPAFEWFQRVQATDLAPNEITYEMLIEALVRDAKPRLAYEQYLRAQKEGLHLSGKAYDAVVLSAQVYGATIDVSNLGPRPREKKIIAKPRKNLSEFCDLADIPRRSKPFDKEEVYLQNIQENQQ